MIIDMIKSIIKYCYLFKSLKELVILIIYLPTGFIYLSAGNVTKHERILDISFPIEIR